MQTQISSHDQHDQRLEKIYAHFRRITTAFLKEITGPSTDVVEQEGTWLLNRLILLWLLQQREFLCGKPQYLQELFALSEDGSFYQMLFLPLLRQLGNWQSAQEDELVLGPVPSLEAFFGPERMRSALFTLSIPDSAFAELFSCLGSYAWTLEENEDTDAINPEIIAHLLEKRLNGKDGAYYTPRDVTEYIAKNTILPGLVDRVRQTVPEYFDPQEVVSIWWRLEEYPDRYIYDARKKGADLPLPPEIALGNTTIRGRGEWNNEAPSDYALPKETWRDVVERRRIYEEVRTRLASGQVTQINDFVTYNLNIRQFLQDVIERCTQPALLLTFYEVLTGGEEGIGLTILDPTCGAGAFLLTALTILEPIYTACLVRMEAFLERRPYNLNYYQLMKMIAVLELEREHPNRRFFVRKMILLNNLYGVDLSKEAIDVSKLLLLLQLVAAAPTAEDLQWLPDLDFSIQHGNTLVGIATEADLRALLIEKDTYGNDLYQPSIFALDQTQAKQPTNGVEEMEQIMERMGEVNQLMGELHRMQLRHGGGVQKD